MSGGRWITRPRGIAALAGIALVLVAGALLVRGAFRGGAGGAGTHDAHDARGAGVHFDDATLERLRAAYASYEQARALLAADRVEGLDGPARATAAALEAAQPAAAAQGPAVEGAIARALAAAGALERARDLESARKAFDGLGEALVALGHADTRLAEGWHLFECPMVEGFATWFQRAEKPENPYMGPAMLACATRRTWDEHELAATPAAGAATASGDSAAVAYYTCAMHPSVRQSGPGLCPLCNMELTPVTHGDLSSGAVVVDPVRRQRIGVRTEPVERRSVTRSVRAVGRVQVDETGIADVNLRAGGWVHKLHVDETGQPVRRGQTLFTFYSPELYTAQREHLSAVRRRGETATPAFDNLARSSRTRLVLLGMSEAQVDELERRGEVQEYVPVLSPAGGYVMEKEVVQGARIEPGMRVYRIANLGRVWVDADVFESDLPLVHAGQRVEVELPYVPGRRYPGRVDYVYPSLTGATRTGRVRVVLNNPDLALKPEMYANVLFEVPLGEKLVIRDSAVLYTGPRRLVFVDQGGGRLVPREVEVGVHADGWYEVLSGLSEGEVVVTSGNFLIAAESRIRSAANYWDGSHAGH